MEPVPLSFPSCCRAMHSMLPLLEHLQEDLSLPLLPAIVVLCQFGITCAFFHLPSWATDAHAHSNVSQ